MNTIDGDLMKKALQGAAGLLEKNKEEVDSLNVFPVPDGDTGTNMSLTIKSALKQGLLVEGNNASEVALGASQGSLMGARGNSGVILSQLFRGFANALKNQKEIDVKSLAEGLKQASDTAYKAVMKPTEGTILTVARECGEFAISIYREDKDVLSFLKRVIDHGNATLEKTPDMLPVLKKAGVVDAGGKGFMYVLIGAYNSLAGIEEFEDETKEKTKDIKTEFVHREPMESDDIEYGYCTELMINTKYKDIDRLREELSEIGDSLMVVEGEDLIKIHIHTNDPGLVIQKGTLLGALSDIKIDNMRYQHEEILLKKELEEKKHAESQFEEVEEKKYSFVAVSIGQGIDKVFEELNVDCIVHGGQTMNPSTEDIFNAIEKTKGENVFILPNNGNIILAAEQTKELSSRNIIVLPTKTIPEGISAMLAFDLEDDVENNVKNMTASIKSVATGQVTYAVRDTELDDKKIYKDDVIGISKGDILVSGKDMNKISIDLIKEMINDDISLITVFYGEDIKEEEANELASSLEDELEAIDIEIIYGGQPIYYYVFSLE